MKAPPLELIDVACVRGGKEVLQGVSWRAPDEGLVTVVGPNGAGKSSLMRLLGKLERASRGEALLFGKPIATMAQRDLARLVAYVPQIPELHFELSVDEFLSMSRYPFSSLLGKADPDGARETARAVELVGIEKFRGRAFQSLSGGERQKVLFAGAIAQSPRILLLDEPSSYLDPKQSAELYGLMAELVKERRILVVAVTHDMNDALVHSNELVALKEGRLFFSGSPEEFSWGGFHEKLFEKRFLLLRHPYRNLWVTIPGSAPE